MADISKLKLPNGSEYDLKVYTDHIAPMMSKTFQGVIGTANDFANATFYFGSIIPSNDTDIWKIKYRVTAEAAGQAAAKGYYEVECSCVGSTFIAYKVFNFQKNTSYRPLYNHVIYRAKIAGITSGYGHLLGERLYSSWNATTAANARTFVIDIIECVNCTFTFFESAIKYSAAPGTGSTNYDNYTEFNGTTQGVTRTGTDANDVNYQNRVYYSQSNALKVVAAGGRYTLTMSIKGSNYLLPITSTDNVTNGGAHTYNMAEFDPFGEIYFRNDSGALAAETTVGNASLYRQIMVDARYSFTGVLNGASSIMSVGKQVYLVCVPQTNGNAVLHTTPLAVTLPNTDDGLLYILLGYAYNTYQFELLLNHPVYRYKDGAIREVSGYADIAGNALTVNNHTVEKNVPANAVFTDTTYESKTAVQNGTDVSLVTTGEKYIWNSKTTNTGTVTKVTAGTGLSIGSTAGGNFTTSGTINHTNTITAQNTQAIYPIKIDAQGHISAYGSAVTPLTASSTLDATKLNGTIPTACLPSYVDDVLQYTTKANFPTTGEAGKIYVDKTTNLTWRWGGSSYVEISPSLALGTTSSTAFRGDYGNAAYTHAVTNKGSAFSSGLYKITTNSEGHVTAATAVQKSDITGLGIPGTDNDTKNTAGSTDSSKKLFLIGAETQAANPQTYSQDTAYVGTDGKLYSNSKVVLTGGSNAASSVTITPSTTDIYSMTSAGSVTLPTLTFAMDTTDTKKLKITFVQGAVTLPGRSSVIKAWTGYTAATAAAQTFTGSSS